MEFFFAGPLVACANRHKPPQSEPLKHLGFFFVAIISLSQAANLVRAAHAPALMVGFWRLAGAALLMLALRAWQTRKTNHFWEPVSRVTWIWSAVSGSFFFLHLWTFFYSAQNTSIANCMVIFSINPIFTALGAWIFLKDRFENRYALAFLLAFSGIAFLFSDRMSLDTARIGDFSALISAFFFSIYILAGKKARLQMNTEQFTWIIYSIAALLFFLSGWHLQTQWLNYPSQTWWAILGTIIFPTLLGHVLFTHLLKFFNINWLSCGKLMEPALSAFVAYLAFHEELKMDAIAAFALTALAVLILFWPMLFAKGPRLESQL
jgi:drug/metabolite transporter (DMT)-like permease